MNGYFHLLIKSKVNFIFLIHTSIPRISDKQLFSGLNRLQLTLLGSFQPQITMWQIQSINAPNASKLK